ncbi:hypothetical protein LHFGNBLO_004920 [Mesorhizobium sp. AR10]|uniref:hypothetical protein n=1 Tax=Mesorhizobium sp. AR10 TaxID=2865839 RepID=UPI00215DF107|nr:hypothetical protein [Mesorhizobium sp. AR10]UVK37825.1 hypothetical protein LHFGNBLO_004920 [Mesorhizobium sp. AR10]
MKPLALLPYALMLALAAPVAAQTNDQSDQAPAQSGDCQVEPQGQNGVQKPPDDANSNLTGKLDPCDGVLQPPPTGDQGMTAPPPDQGRTPVIKPGEVPAQPPKQ